jgi:conjugal transfer/entry exclusion protein
MRTTLTVLIVILAIFLGGAYSQGNIRRALAQPVGGQQIVSDEVHVVQGIEHQIQAQEKQQLQTYSKLLQSDIMKAEQFPTKKIP